MNSLGDRLLPAVPSRRAQSLISVTTVSPSASLGQCHRQTLAVEIGQGKVGNATTLLWETAT
jgi:hypothetical protein